MADLKDKQFITSKEVLSKTGISRATLNNYIKIGILPRPVVKKADEKMQGIKHIGYFPESVLEIIDSVKQSKQKGEAMENIARKIKESSIVEMFPPSEKSQTNFKNQEAQLGIEYRSVFVNEEDFQNRRRSIEPERNASASFESGDNLTLTITKMDLPAYLVNHNFEVEWVNSEAERIIFNRQIRALNDIE